MSEASLSLRYALAAMGRVERATDPEVRALWLRIAKGHLERSVQFANRSDPPSEHDAPNLDGLAAVEDALRDLVRWRWTIPEHRKRSGPQPGHGLRAEGSQ